MVLGKVNIHMQKNEHRSPSPVTNTNSKWTSDLNIRSETMIPEQNTGEILRDMRTSKDFGQEF